MILGSREIYRNIRNGNIQIDPFDKKRLNPNSYNLTLNNILYTYKETILNCKKQCHLEPIHLNDEGFMLTPKRLYLGETVEHTWSLNHVPMIEGRSSLARLGISIHISAGFGDIGYKGKWTLEITVTEPVIIYPFIECCQIFWYEVKGIDVLYNGKYQNNNVRGSKLYEEF